jgi:hypothetical protein
MLLAKNDQSFVQVQISRRLILVKLVH